MTPFKLSREQALELASLLQQAISMNTQPDNWGHDNWGQSRINCRVGSMIKCYSDISIITFKYYSDPII